MIRTLNFFFKMPEHYDFGMKLKKIPCHNKRNFNN